MALASATVHPFDGSVAREQALNEETSGSLAVLAISMATFRGTSSCLLVTHSIQAVPEALRPERSNIEVAVMHVSP